MGPTSFRLNTGASIAAIGFGTWQDEEAQAKAVETALAAGCRYIDTASMYRTEEAVARGIRVSVVRREDIFLVTKLWNHKHKPSDVEPALDASLKALGTDYVDLWLMHWPAAFEAGDNMFPVGADGKVATADIDFVETWKAMEAVHLKGKAKAIGVSNFSQHEINRLLEEGSVVSAVYQMECHPLLAQDQFNPWHEEKGIHVAQYNPFSNANRSYSQHPQVGKLLEDPIMAEVASNYGKSTAQIALAWALAHRRSVIAKSTTEGRIRASFEAASM